MASRRKVKRTLAKMLLVWVGRMLLGRVQRHSLKTMSMQRRRRNASTERLSNLASRFRRTALTRTAPATVAPSSRSGRRRAGRGLLVAVISAAAVAALKTGVEHVIETEREHEVVTPNFDVFADDEE